MACRNNNQHKMAHEHEIPERGGNTPQYKILLGAHHVVECEEYTMVQWKLSPTSLILLSLMEEYERMGPRCALLDVKTIKVGLSFKHHKKVENIFQVLYVKQLGHAMI
mmetsp:Transcript_29605/g.28827  ORF Transcript_29605/g.28827 Transcript_29605/m.28827 type:complete len:108 (-) Transcript_29605:65-388(-)